LNAYLKEPIMNKLLISLLVAASAAVAIPVHAGRDGDQIYLQEKANQAAATQRAQEAAQPRSARKIILPLDHGPRADTTPWLNKQRLLRVEKACADATGQSETEAGSERK
jgi:hypothetical protein